MALLTAGSSTTTVLRTVQYFQGMSTADLAALNALVVNGSQAKLLGFPLNPIVSQGLIYYGNRGSLKLNAGDWLVADPVTGYPFIVPNSVVVGGSFVHS